MFKKNLRHSKPPLPFFELKKKLTGELLTDSLTKIIYSRDASIYEKKPLAICLPRNARDIKLIVDFAKRHRIAITPRTAGTSLAGQTVGKGIIIDMSKHMNRILEVNQKEQWVRVEPGVVRDELNQFLKPYRLHFGVNTSTSNRAMIGGMVANNSSGSLSIIYGTTRENLLALSMVLSHGKEVVFQSEKNLLNKKSKNDLEGRLYQNIYRLLSSKENQAEIKKHYPHSELHRKNTGYALDELLKSQPFDPNSQENFNFCKLLAGSEGTLGLFTEIKLKLHPLPPSTEVLVCSHFKSLKQALNSAQISVQHPTYACELIDHIILSHTSNSIIYTKDRFFIKGDPAAILVNQFRGQNREEALKKANRLINDLKKQKLGYTHPKVFYPQSERVWALRAAGLGLLSNHQKETRAVEGIEDTAVRVKVLPQYIRELDQMLKSYGQQPVYYAHAGAGELHIRPILNLRRKEEIKRLKEIIHKTTLLVKKFKGSLSGEHGDGIIRSEFIPLLLGEKINQMFKDIKQTWDPENIFNPGKIVDPDPMDQDIALQNQEKELKLKTGFDFSQEINLTHFANRCSGSGDCRKQPSFKGVMCPSYQATKDEKDTTRARARTLYHVLSQPSRSRRFSSPELIQVMDLCLSCKGCTSECPSGVDMAMMKAEFLYQRRKAGYRSLKDTLFAYQPRLMYWIRKSIGAAIYNKLTSGFLSQRIKPILGLSPQRRIPQLSSISLKEWYLKNYFSSPKKKPNTLYLFCDELTDQLYSTTGITAIRLLHRLGYQVKIIDHLESGRTFISKGFLDQAKTCAKKNIDIFSKLENSYPIIGIEPSAILTFKDEYPKLLIGSWKEKALRISKKVFLIDDFLSHQIEQKKITTKQFTTAHQTIHFHAHCHQKSLSETRSTLALLNLPKNYRVQEIPSGCCGMAGSFGYEKEHYWLSQKVFDLVLRPYLEKNYQPGNIVATNGISCREQIFDGLNIETKHPVEILYSALKPLSPAGFRTKSKIE